MSGYVLDASVAVTALTEPGSSAADLLSINDAVFQVPAIFDAEVGENFQDFGVLLGVMRIRNVGDLQDQRGFLDFFERGAEGGDQIVRQIAQKTYCV